MHAYFVTICTHHRAHVFNDGDLARTIISELARVATADGFVVDAYCLMPDHLHALIEACEDGADLRRVTSAFKQRTAYEFMRQTGRRLWQAGYFEHVLRSEDDLRGICRYLVENPLRARLVADPREYAWWGSQRWTREEVLAAVATPPRWRRRRS